jgi:Mg2+-importing ATPase
LTKDEVHLCHYVDPSGNENKRVAQLAFTNAFNQSGKKNSIDSAILKHGSVDEKDDFIVRCEKVGEIPFNFETRRSSCIMMTPAKKLLLVCKGAFEEVSSLCTSLRHEGKVVPLDAARYNALSNQSAAFNDDGYRVLIVATRELCQSDMESEDGTLPEDLDSKMTVEGLLTFLDPPKDDAAISIQRLQELGVDVRILTGDNLGVALKICRSLNLVREFEEEGLQAITGPDLARIGDADEFNRTVKNCKIFAKLTPSQKGEVVMSLRNAGEVVGMLGDGINDCVALRFADAGISVDSGASVAKDCADIILTEKELAIVADGVVTGRITHGNTYAFFRFFLSPLFHADKP